VVMWCALFDAIAEDRGTNVERRKRKKAALFELQLIEAWKEELQHVAQDADFHKALYKLATMAGFVRPTSRIRRAWERRGWCKPPVG